MTEITYFMVVPFDHVDGGLLPGDAIRCGNPVAAIERAKGLWKTFGHAGAIAFSRTSDFERAQFYQTHIFRRYGRVADEFLKVRQ
jgi:hypothetical protein